MTTNEPSPPPSLVYRVMGGLRWSALDVALQQLMRFVVTVILTRLLAPEEFGLLAMAVVFTAMASLVGDLGLGPALIQRQSLTRSHVVTAFSVTTLVGAALSLLLALASGPIADFYGEPELQSVLLVMSVVFLVRGFSGVPRDLLRRDMRFRALAIASSTGVMVGGVAGIALALGGAGVWALVAQVLIEAFLTAVLVLTLAWRAGAWSPGIGLHAPALKDLGSFGAFVSGGRLAHYGATNADNLIVGKVLGASALGLYNLAYRLMLFPVLKVADVIANVTMPALAAIQDDIPRVARAYQRTIEYVSLVCFPLSAVTVAVAPVLIPALFGSRWEPAVLTVQILALNGARLAIARLSGVVYEATGRPKWDFFMLSVTFVVYVIAFGVGVQWGIEGVAIAYTVAGYALLPVDMRLVHRALNVKAFSLLGGLWKVAVASALAAMFAAFALMLTDDSMSDAYATLAVLAVGCISYAAAIKVLMPATVFSLRESLSRST